MKAQVSPKQLARAIQVSESSVKRWCDQGSILSVRTAGGHRRITLAAVLDFLRENGYDLVRPELLGLPATAGRTAWALDRAQAAFGDALLAGDEDQARRILLDLHLAKHPWAAILDEVVTTALRGIGERWRCGQAAVYQERCGCEICLRLLHELRTLAPAAFAPRGLAMGGTPAGDVYQIPNAMVELVLRLQGWETISLGSGLPFDTLRTALLTHRPQLFWLSVSHVDDERAFLAGWKELSAPLPFPVLFATGGQALAEPLRRHMPQASFCNNLQDLESLARAIGQ
jgi:MerR family transcriptional regulator, light-induced transcriptional regulator